MKRAKRLKNFNREVIKHAFKNLFLSYRTILEKRKPFTMAKALFILVSVLFFLGNLSTLPAKELESRERGEQAGNEPHVAEKNTSNLDREIDNFTSQILQQLMQNDKKNVAVSEFTDLVGNITDIGKFLTDEVIHHLIISGKIKVIDRKYFNKILKDNRLPLSNALDPVHVKTLHNLLDIDAIITGTIVDMGTRIKINAHLYNSVSGNIFGAANMESQIDDTIRNLLEQQTLEPLEINLEQKIEDLSRQITQGMIDHKKKKIVVMELPDLSGEITNFSKFLYEELITHLMMNKNFDIIEKKLYDNSFAEYEDSSSAIQITSDLSKEIGKVLGADAIAFGTMSDLGTSVNVNIRIITPETAIPFAVATAKITSDITVRSLLETTAERRTRGAQTPAVIRLGDEAEPLQKPKIMKSKTRVHRLKKSRRIFFTEDFNTYTVGEILPKWGKGIVVTESLGKKGITSKISGENTLTQQVNFPDNFKFSFNIKGNSWTWGTFTFYNSDEDYFKMQLRIKDNYFYVKFPDKAETKVSCNAEEYNSLFIIKKGNECQLYLNDILVTNDSFKNKTRFTHFDFKCRLDTLYLANFSGVEL